jgi:cytochrome P450
MVRCTTRRIVRVVPTDEETDMTTTDARQNSIATVCEALGVPRRDWPLFSGWSAGPLTPNALDALCQYVDVMIADRCRQPGGDLLSQLIEMEIDGEGLTTDDIRSYVLGLVADIS